MAALQSIVRRLSVFYMFLQAFEVHAARNPRALRRRFLVDSDVDGYEYDDKEFHARGADSSDYSVHQFLASGDGRDGSRFGDGDQAFAMRGTPGAFKKKTASMVRTFSSDNFLQALMAHAAKN